MSSGSQTSRTRLAVVIVGAAACAAVGALIVAATFGAPTDVELIRRAVVRDAGFTQEQWRALQTEIGSIDRSPGMYANLTDYLFTGGWHVAAPSFSADLDQYRDASPSDVADAFGEGPASIIRLEDITSFYCRPTSGDRRCGTLTFEHHPLWRGRLDFEAERREGAWTITAFAIPNTRHELRLMDNGLWMKYPVYEDSIVSRHRLYIQVGVRGEISFLGRTYDVASLGALLRERAGNSPKDAEGIPLLGVEFAADPFTPFGHMTGLVKACQEAGIRQLRLTVRDKGLDLRLRRFRPRGEADRRARGTRIIKIIWDRSPTRAFVPANKDGRASVGPGVIMTDSADIPRPAAAVSSDATIQAGADVPFHCVFRAVKECRESGVERFEFLIAR